MSEKAQLIVVAPARKGAHFFYECSLCSQRFILPEDRDPKDAAAELVAAFKEHAREQHSENVTG